MFCWCVKYSHSVCMKEHILYKTLQLLSHLFKHPQEKRIMRINVKHLYNSAASHVEDVSQCCQTEPSWCEAGQLIVSYCSRAESRSSLLVSRAEAQVRVRAPLPWLPLRGAASLTGVAGRTGRLLPWLPLRMLGRLLPRRETRNPREPIGGERRGTHTRHPSIYKLFWKINHGMLSAPSWDQCVIYEHILRN